MTLEQHEKAGEILDLYYNALQNAIFWTKQSNSYWANEYQPAKERYLHKVEISRMAARRIYDCYVKFVKKHL